MAQSEHYNSLRVKPNHSDMHIPKVSNKNKYNNILLYTD